MPPKTKITLTDAQKYEFCRDSNWVC